MKSPTRISLVRHGEVHNPSKIIYGRLPGFRLSDRGHAQARSAGTALRGKPIAAIFCSPLLRACQTAHAIRAVHHQVEVRASGLITEVYSPFEGRPLIEMRARNDDVYTGSGLEFEQPKDILDRIQQFAREVRQQFSGRHVVAVTHGDNITFLILWAKDKPLDPENKIKLASLGIPDGYPATASITTFTYHTTALHERPTVEYLRPY